MTNKNQEKLQILVNALSAKEDGLILLEFLNIIHYIHNNSIFCLHNILNSCNLDDESKFIIESIRLSLELLLDRLSISDKEVLSMDKYKILKYYRDLWEKPRWSEDIIVASLYNSIYRLYVSLSGYIGLLKSSSDITENQDWLIMLDNIKLIDTTGVLLKSYEPTRKHIIG